MYITLYGYIIQFNSIIACINWFQLALSDRISNDLLNILLQDVYVSDPSTLLSFSIVSNSL